MTTNHATGVIFGVCTISSGNQCQWRIESEGPCLMMTLLTLAGCLVSELLGICPSSFFNLSQLARPVRVLYLNNPNARTFKTFLR